MDDKELVEGFGKLVRRLRSEQGYSQESFADACGLHRTYMGSIERGEKNVTIRTVNKVARTLGITLGKLFTELERDQSDV